MQKLGFLLLSLSLLAFSWSGSNPIISAKVKKKMLKSIEKLWKDQAPNMQEFKLSNANSYFKPQTVFSIATAEKQEALLSVRRIHGCKIGGCEADDGSVNVPTFIENPTEDSYETFDYMMILGNDHSILHVEVVDYPGEYGYEVNSKSWLKQFKGYQGEELIYGKDVDGISGATISATSITYDIQDTYHAMMDLLQDDTIGME